MKKRCISAESGPIMRCWEKFAALRYFFAAALKSLPRSPMQ
jgi:hypothetical protein